MPFSPTTTSVLVTSFPACRSVRARDVQTLESRIIPNVIRRLAVRHLPQDIALVQIDRA